MVFYLCDKQQVPVVNENILNLIRYLLHILAVAAMIVAFSSCEDEGYLNSPDVQLSFSGDTIMFDTIFTTIGSTTQNLRVYNPYNESLLISSIRLAGGEFSNFRMNINGEVTNEAYDV